MRTGEPVVSPILRKAAAILIGLMLSGAAAVAVHSWVSDYVERQGVNELNISAGRVIALTEARLDRAIEALEELARRQVRSCVDADRDAMHEVSFRVVPVKEVSIVGSRRPHPMHQSGDPVRAAPVAFANRDARAAGDARGDVVIECCKIGERMQKSRRRAIAETLDRRAQCVRSAAARTAIRSGPVLQSVRLAAGDGILIGERSAATARRPAIAGGRAQSALRHVRDHLDRRAAVLASPFRHRSAATIGAGATAALILARRLRAAAGATIRLAVLGRAIRNGELIPYYQPIVDLNDARVVSAEVLVRWRKPDGSLVPPVQFIPLAESSGLIAELTRALMRRVCAEAGAEIGARPDFRIGFNLSACHFADEAIVADVGAIFGASPIALDQVLLEVTERQALDDLAVARRVIAALQGIGVHVGIDDLGTGHSGLSYAQARRRLHQNRQDVCRCY